MTVLRTERTYPLTLTADPLNTGIVAAFDWAAEDGSTTLANGKDHSGNGNDFAPFGTTPTVVETPAGKGRDTSIGRSSSVSYYDAAGASAIGMDVGTGDFSVYKRLRSPSVAPASTTLRSIGRLTDGSGTKVLFNLYEVSSTGKWHWHVVFDTATIVLNWADTTGLNINTDSILHVTRESGVVKCYVDGVLEKTTNGNTTNLLSTTGASHTVVGNFNSGNIIDAIHVDDIYWTRALSGTEVAAHAANPYAYYDNDVADDEVTVTSPTTGATVSGSISITGTYVGGSTVTEITASFNGGAYDTIDATPSGGTFSGTLTGQAAGTGTLTVRTVNGGTTVAETTVTAITVSTDEIAFTTPDTTTNGAVPYRMFQRDINNQASVRVTGTYSGSPASIEYQWAGGSWTTLDAAPIGGAFDETITLQGPDQGDLSVRFSDSTSITATLASIGVGDVYIVGGQSNHVGMSASYTQPSSDVGWVSVKLGKNGVWQEHQETSSFPFDDRTDATYSVQTNISTPEGSYFGALATSIMAAGVPVAFVPCALGSTGIAAWAVSTSTTSLYGAMLARATQIGDYKAVLWWQGENETSGSMTQSEFASALNALVNDWYGRTGVRWVVMAINSAGNGANFQAIHDAIVEVGQTNVNVAAYADLDGAFSSSIHYGTVGEIAEISSRVFDALNSAYYSLVVEITLVNESGVASTDLTGLKWAFFDQATPDIFEAPVATGALETTNESGVIRIDVSGTTLSSGDIGWLIVTDSDGTTTQSPSHKAFSGPVEVM